MISSSERRFVRKLAAETLKAILSNQFILDVKKTNIYLMIVEIRQLWQKRACMLYLVCENGPKIPVGTCFIDLQGKPVQKCAATLAAARIAG